MTNAAAAISAKQFHYFALSFSYISHNTLQLTNVYMAYPDRRVSVPRIEQAKVQAKVPADSTVLGISYLGRMTSAEIRNLR